MKKIVLLTVGLLLIGISTAYGYDYAFSMTNPANPASPLNPMNPLNPASPVSPLNPNNVNRNSSSQRTTKKHEEYTREVYRVYEYGYKGKHRTTKSREVSLLIDECLRHNGGYACLGITIE